MVSQATQNNPNIAAATELSALAVDVNPLVTVLQLGNQVLSNVANSLYTGLVPHAAALNYLNVKWEPSSVATLIQSGSGILGSISIVDACTTSSLSGWIYDCPTVAHATLSNRVMQLPTSGFFTYDFPYTSGLVVKPSSIGQTVALSYL